MKMKYRDETSLGSRIKMHSSVKSPTPNSGARVRAGQENFGFGYRGGASGLPVAGRGSGVASTRLGTSTAGASGGPAGGGSWRGGDGTPAEGIGP
jgi:hypothetical protein